MILTVARILTLMALAALVAVAVLAQKWTYEGDSGTWRIVVAPDGVLLQRHPDDGRGSGGGAQYVSGWTTSGLEGWPELRVGRPGFFTLAFPWWAPPAVWLVPTMAVWGIWLRLRILERTPREAPRTGATECHSGQDISGAGATGWTLRAADRKMVP